MSIKARLLIAICVIVAAAFAGIGVATVRLTRAEMIDRVDESLVATSARAPRGNDPGRRGGGHDPHGDSSGRSTALIVCDSKGTVLYAQPSGFSDEPDPLPRLEPQEIVARAGTIFTAPAAGDSG